jgi:hypothetical protein
MSDTHTDLVIQISTSEPAAAPVANGEKADDGRLVQELRRCLQPGAEIALVIGGFVATTSILWLSGPLEDGGLRAGVRLLGVSALPAEKREAAVWDPVPEGTMRFSNASIASQL